LVIVNLSLFCFNSSLSIKFSDGPMISVESLLDSINFKSGFILFSIDRSDWITIEGGVRI